MYNLIGILILSFILSSSSISADLISELPQRMVNCKKPPQGPMGPTGSNGLPGSPGLQGLEGAQGAVGTEGPQGTPGQIFTPAFASAYTFGFSSTSAALTPVDFNTRRYHPQNISFDPTIDPTTFTVLISGTYLINWSIILSAITTSGTTESEFLQFSGAITS